MNYNCNNFCGHQMDPFTRVPLANYSTCVRQLQHRQLEPLVPVPVGMKYKSRNSNYQPENKQRRSTKKPKNVVAEKNSEIVDDCEISAQSSKDSEKSLSPKNSATSLCKKSSTIQKLSEDSCELQAEVSECDNIADESEVWLLRCSKGFIPKMLNDVLCKSGMQYEMDPSFTGKAMIAIEQEKVAQYQLLCDNLEIVSTIGSINVSGQTCVDEETSSSQNQSFDSIDCDDSEESSELSECFPLPPPKPKKKEMSKKEKADAAMMLSAALIGVGW